MNFSGALRFCSSLCLLVGLGVFAPACDTIADGEHVVGVHIDSVIPNQIPATGGILVTVIGRNFDAGTKVTVGGQAAVGVTAVTGELLTFVAPKSTFGGNDLAIENSTGQRAELPGGVVYYADRVAFAERTVLLPGFDFSFYDLADLNGDGFDDIVAVTYSRASTIAIHLNRGDGRFAAQAPIETATSFDLSLADLDGDGDPEILTGAEVYRNRGDGTFEPPLKYTQEFGFGRVVADFDGDGALDFAALGFQTTTIYRLVDGAVVAHKTLTDVVQAYSSAVAADLNEDGKADLVAPDSSMGKNCVAIRLAPDFDAATGSVVCGDYTDFPQALVARDLDGDKHLDIIAQSNTATSTFRGDGLGHLETPRQYASLCGASTFNRFITPVRGSSLLYASCGSGALSIFSVSLSTFWQQASLDYEAKLGDLDGDGALDAVVNDFGVGLTARYADANQTAFTPHPSLFVGKKVLNSSNVTPIVAALQRGETPTLASAWYDTITLYRKNADAPNMKPVGEPLVVSDYFDGAGVIALSSADLDGDGDLDLVAWLSQTTGAYQSRSLLVPIFVEGERLTLGDEFGEGAALGVWTADLDGDKRADVITYEYDDNSIAVAKVHRNRGTDGWATETFATPAQMMVFADVDGDGDDDEIGFSVEPSPHFTLYRMDAGQVVAEVAITPTLAAADAFTSVSDFKVQSLGSAFVMWTLGSGKLGTGLVRTLFASDGTFVSDAFVEARGSMLRIGDVDGDRLADAVVFDNGKAFAFSGRSPTLNARAPLTLAPTWGVSPNLFDFDGDGLDEVYYTTPTQRGKIVIVQNQSE